MSDYKTRRAVLVPNCRASPTLPSFTASGNRADWLKQNFLSLKQGYICWILKTILAQFSLFQAAASIPPVPKSAPVFPVYQVHSPLCQSYVSLSCAFCWFISLHKDGQHIPTAAYSLTLWFKTTCQVFMPKIFLKNGSLSSYCLGFKSRLLLSCVKILPSPVWR